MQLSAVGGVFPPQLAPSSKLYSILKPAIVVGGVTTMGPQPAFTVGAGGAAGYITTLTVLLTAQAPGPAVPAAVVPQAAVSTYRARKVWQPGVAIVGEAEKAPPSMLYCTEKPGTAGTVGKLKAALQVFAGSVNVGAAGNMVTFTVLLIQDAGLALPAAIVSQTDAVTYRAWIV